MTTTRREFLALGASALGAIPILDTSSAFGAVADEVPMADIKPPEYRIETGATLHVLRPKGFIDADEAYWRANTKRFIADTGVEVRVEFVSWEDLRPRTAIVANMSDGPDIVIGFSSDPQLYAGDVLDMTELADYLGTKYGGWYQLAEAYGRKWGTRNWVSIPVGGGTGPTVYRQSWVREAGYDRIPDNLDGFLDLCMNLRRIGHPCGFSLGHALGDANAFASWLLWAHNAFLVDEKGKVALDSRETQAALKYAAELQKTMVPGTLSWDDAGNNRAYAAGEIGLTFNNVSLYHLLKNAADPKLRAIAEDTQHQTIPRGMAPRPPILATPMNAMVFRHSQFPNAAREYIRFMMEAPQYGKWLSHCSGYWSQSLKAYSRMKFWQTDPKLIPFADGMNTSYYDGYKGPVTPASSAVSANYVIVDMFARVVKGDATPQEAARRAATQAEHYYRQYAG